MHYLVARAMEVARLTLDQVTIIHNAETRIDRHLMPFEIDMKLNLEKSVSKFWGIPKHNTPEAERIREVHRERIEKRIHELGWFVWKHGKGYNFLDCESEVGPVDEYDLDCLHAWDWRIFHEKNNINWMCDNGVKKRVKTSDVLVDEVEIIG